jgi:glycosyltransferase involved in cell wall biosynthesis
MHIAWIGKKSPFCGNVTYSREVTNALLDRGYQVSFFHFAHEESDEPEGTTSGTQEVALPCLYKSQIYTVPTLTASKVLQQSLRQLRPDVVHASLTLSPLDFLLPEICQEVGIPLVATFHPPFDGNRRNLQSGTQLLAYQLYAPFLANYDQVIIFSELQKNFLIKLGMPADHLAVIPNGVDVQKYAPGPSNFKAEVEAEKLFVYQGRIATEKNVESLLKAWKLAKMGSDCKLVIVGSGALVTSLKSAYGQKDGIIWLGFVGSEERRCEILRAADVFILPSFLEGLSLSLLEAMASGVACVATDAGADGEVLDGGAGIVISTRRVSSQLQIILPLLRDQPEFRVILGRKARNRVLERYTLTKNINALEKLYDKVVSTARLQLSY